MSIVLIVLPNFCEQTILIRSHLIDDFLYSVAEELWLHAIVCDKFMDKDQINVETHLGGLDGGFFSEIMPSLGICCFLRDCPSRVGVPYI